MKFEQNRPKLLLEFSICCYKNFRFEACFKSCGEPSFIICFTKILTKYMFSFSFNRLSALPVSVEKLENLSVLNLDGNRFLEVPECVFELVCLNVLCMSSNMLTTVPKGVLRLTKLQVQYVLYFDPRALRKRKNPSFFYIFGNNEAPIDLNWSPGIFWPVYQKKAIFRQLIIQKNRNIDEREFMLIR